MIAPVLPGTPPHASSPDAPAQLPLEQVRRADWRFLLPAGLPSRVGFIGDRHGALARALERVHAGVFHVGDRAAPGPFELLVVERATRQALADAASLLEPGGWLYAEADRRSLLKAGPTLRLVARLHALGMMHIEAYWPVPDFERCRCIVSLRDPSVGIRHLRRDRDRLLLRVLDAACRAPGATRLLPDVLPCVAVVAQR